MLKTCRQLLVHKASVSPNPEREKKSSSHSNSVFSTSVDFQINFCPQEFEDWLNRFGIDDIGKQISCIIWELSGSKSVWERCVLSHRLC